jgi:gas vesicle protein
MNNFLKSILKTAVYFLDQSDRIADNVRDVRDRVSDSLDNAADRVSDLRDRATGLYEGDNHTLRNVLFFAAGVGVGVGAGMLLAPASGEEIRGSIGNKVQDIGSQVRNRFSSASQTRRSATGTEGI